MLYGVPLRRRDFIAALASLPLARSALAQAPKLPTQHDAGLPPGVFRCPAPRDAAIAAMLDIGMVGREDQPYQWYVWDNLGTRESLASISWAVNGVLNQTSTICRPRRILHDGVKLLAWNLLDLVPSRKDFERVWNTFQELAEFEPYFHQPSAEHVQRKTIWHYVKPYRASDGRIYDYVGEEIVERRGFEFGIHAGGASLNLLSELAGGNLLPICRGDWMLATFWTSIRNIDGIHGRYYDLAGIQKSKVKGVSDFDAILKQVGASKDLDPRLKQKSVQVSDVTDLWRTAEAQLTLGVRPADGPGLVTITHDIRDDNDDEAAHGLLNLIDVKDDAREIIFARPNALDGFVLTDGEGNLLDEAVSNVASWPNAPWKRKHLFSGMACIECHAGGGGLNPLTNVILSNDRLGFSPVYDLKKRGGKVANRETQDILKSQFLGDLEPALIQRRLTYARKVDEATYGVFQPKTGEKPAIVQNASRALMDIYRGYFARMTPRKLLEELGYLVSEKLALAVLNRMMDAEHDDDARIRTLVNGSQILRSDVHKTFYEIANRDRFRQR